MNRMGTIAVKSNFYCLSIFWGIFLCLHSATKSRMYSVGLTVNVLSGTAIQRAPSVPVVRPGVETEEERMRTRRQHAVYRRLFMDIEREQVKENIRQRSHRQRMAAYVVPNLHCLMIENFIVSFECEPSTWPLPLIC